MTKWTIPNDLVKLRNTSPATGTLEKIRRCHAAAARIEQLEAAIIAALRERDEDMRTILRAGLHGEGGK